MIILGHLIVIFLSILFSYKWIRISNDTFINSESFRDSTKLGITITSIAFPLMIILMNHIFGQLLYFFQFQHF
jgi:hypothetical protein